ncbi:MAG: M23 family metallopeptidase [Candidatus Cloacimonetes bacterium]|nr:M23 family metallopeptidase [Candidatus Cloacimonadota bacterium]MCF7814422.1 M23 family metallopeptidase [Candidatus Cloacimonadota bacterium]MCF7869016.1 M23 family metallopeptidase [Candidatus Cloacimonadota bacterium]MCF7884406.1 M23 family metallopeptidase [Candidatus Cloacimonadota bacterium]
MNRFFLIFFVLIFFLISCQKEEPKEVIEIDPFHYKRGELEKGETLANALMDEEIDNATVYMLVNKLNAIYDLRYSHPADSFLVVLDSSDVVNQLHFMPDQIYTYSVMMDTFNPEKDSVYNYYTKIDTLPTYKVTKVIEGQIDTSLWQGVLDANGNPNLAMTFTQIFQWDIDFFIDPQKGDKFKMVYEEYITKDSIYVKTGNILAAQYNTKGYDKIAYRYKNKKGIAKYYDETGKSFQKAFLKSPLNYSRITSYFGKRVHPVTKKVSFHSGVDYGAARGTPVEATADGTVIYAAWHPNHTGNTVKIRHANGYVTLYGHLSKYGKYKVGMRVQQHDIIGYVGSTGRSTGPHLHYTIYHRGKPINPLRLKNVAGPPVPQKEMEDFQKTVDALNSYFISDQE